MLICFKKTNPVMYTATFNHLKHTDQLNKLGFFFANTLFLKNYTPLSVTNNYTVPYYDVHMKHSLTLSSMVTIRMVHTY